MKAAKIAVSAALLAALLVQPALPASQAYGAGASGTASMTGSAATAADAASAARIIGIAAGVGHGIALWSDGTVTGWGDNKYGKVGDGTVLDQYVPRKVAGLPPIAQVSAGYNSSFALDRSGGVWAWGLYYSSSDYKHGAYYASTPPVKLNGVDGAAAIQAGDYVSGAVLKDGTAVAWYPYYDEKAAVSSVRYLKFAGFASVKALALGGNYAYALKRDGTVRLADLYNPAAGRFRTADELRVKQLQAVTEAVSIAAFRDDLFILRQDGKVFRYQAGSRALEPVKGLDRLVSIKTAYNQLIGLRADGSVWQWNYNVPLAKPRQVQGLSHVTAIAGSSGNLHFALRKDSRPLVWGDGYYENVGSATGSPVNDTDAPRELLQPLSWRVDGQAVDFAGSPTVYDGKLYVPYTSVFAPLGIKVSLGQSNPDPRYYNNRFNVWTFTYRGKSVAFKATDPAVVFLDGKRVDNGETIHYAGNLTQFPLAFICRQFGIALSWNKADGTVSLSAPSAS